MEERKRWAGKKIRRNEGVSKRPGDLCSCKLFFTLRD
jgi:hypothetical protein